MKQKVIALWMYRNDGGNIIQEKLKKRLEEKNIKVINDFDMRQCYCLNGRVYTEKGFDLSSVDVLYHMNADEQSTYQIDILRALELSGVKVINNWDAYTLAKNKLMTNILLKKNGINVPPSMFVNAKQAPLLAKRLFKEWQKVLIKPINRHAGKGIILFDTLEQFIDFIEATDNNFYYYYLEKFIDFGKHDYRIEVFQNKVVCGNCREKNFHSYKTNTHSGGYFNEQIPSKDFEKIALQAAKIIGIETTTVDMIKAKEDNKIYVLEVNPIMCIFIESYQKTDSNITKNKILYDSLAYDTKKINLLTNYLME